MSNVRSAVEVQKVVVLKLSEEEAKILKSFVQNPICDDESKEVSDFRHYLWMSLDRAGIDLC